MKKNKKRMDMVKKTMVKLMKLKVMMKKEMNVLLMIGVFQIAANASYLIKIIVPKTVEKNVENKHCAQ